MSRYRYYRIFSSTVKFILVEMSFGRLSVISITALNIPFLEVDNLTQGQTFSDSRLHPGAPYEPTLDYATYQKPSKRRWIKN